MLNLLYGLQLCQKKKEEKKKPRHLLVDWVQKSLPALGLLPHNFTTSAERSAAKPVNC